MQDLEGDGAVEAGVVGTVDDGRATLVNPGEVRIALGGVMRSIWRVSLWKHVRLAVSAHCHVTPMRMPPRPYLVQFVTAGGPAGWVSAPCGRIQDMTAQILDGRATLATIKEELKGRIAALAERGIVPGLGTVRVGEDPGTRWYVNAKHKDCAEVGIASIRHDLPTGATQS